jgi:murein DD-endopeptidase MepM/ murein hydrolase activator NlpD
MVSAVENDPIEAATSLPSDTSTPAGGPASPTVTPSPTVLPLLPTPTTAPAPAPSSTPTHAPTPAAGPTEVPTASPTSLATPTGTRTGSEPSATPSSVAPGRQWPTPGVDIPVDHYWLARPFPDSAGRLIPSATYLYGSTARGQLRVHHGMDTTAASGTSVVAVAPATVVFAGSDDQQVFGAYNDFYGQLIVLELDRRYFDMPVYVLYGHLSAEGVSTGVHVGTGQPIGEVGMTGIAMGPHLHLEVRVGQNSYTHTRNPGFWVQPLEGLGTIAGWLVDSQGRTLPEASVLVYRDDGSSSPWRVLSVYADDPGINPDDEMGENFLLPDVTPGAYVIKSRVEGQVLSRSVVVRPGSTSFVSLSPSTK